MQDVTDLAFMRVIAGYGAPDYFFTEFFRVHAQSRPERHILRSIDENDTGRPVFAQMIGEDIPAPPPDGRGARARTRSRGSTSTSAARPRRSTGRTSGGGLLRDPDRIAAILAALRDAVPGLLTVKMRIGFEDDANFDRILDIVNANAIDLLTVHGRTVREMYRSDVRYDRIARAAARARCPVLANGNVTSASRAAEIVRGSGAAGVMIGRHAIRNPWIFRQCRDSFAGLPQPRVSPLATCASTSTGSTGRRGTPWSPSGRTSTG